MAYNYCYNYLCYVVAPTIEPVNYNYVSTIGSNVTLECHIINPGMPPVSYFEWNRPGRGWIDNETNSIYIKNSTHFILKLVNLIEDDAGTYRCCILQKEVLRFVMQKLSLHIKGMCYIKQTHEVKQISFEL